MRVRDAYFDLPFSRGHASNSPGPRTTIQRSIRGVERGAGLAAAIVKCCAR